MDPLRLIADRRCAVCGRRGTELCPPCRRALPWLGAPRCPRCGTPAPGPLLACVTCRALGARIGTVRSAFALREAGAALVGAWKDGARRPLATLAARCVCAAVPRPVRGDLLVPVPAAADRAAWRGHDGPADVARALAARWRLPVDDGALRRVHGRPQRGLGAAARRRNAASAFRADRAVRGQVILVDDVLTTGATARACASRLMAAGAISVDVVTVARVVTRS